MKFLDNNTLTDQVPSITQKVMAAIGILFVIGIIYDVIAYALGGNNATISKAMQTIGLSWPIIIFAWGGLGAHFFCPKTDAWMGWWAESRPYIFMGLGILVFRLAWPQFLKITG